MDIGFGAFITKKRQDVGISLRELARQLNLSPVYVCNIEKDRKPAPTPEVLGRMVQILKLDKQETEEFYDLSAISRNRPSVSDDLPEYIMSNNMARTALRTAKDVDATDAEWQEFIERITRRNANGI